MADAPTPHRWYVVYTKPREEDRAADNLQRQGHECYLPRLAVERRRRGRVLPVTEPLFPRYLFIRSAEDVAGAQWGALRSTRGVVKLVGFGAGPVTVDEAFIEALRQRTTDTPVDLQTLFTPGDRVLVGEGPFQGIEAVFQMREGAERAAVLLEFLGQTVTARVPYEALRKAN